VRKIFCDRCGTECINTVAHLNGVVEHKTSQGEQVGMDEIKPVELCKLCFSVLADLLGLIVTPQEMDRADVPMRAMNTAPLVGGHP
jgi:hypothetical protein